MTDTNLSDRELQVLTRISYGQTNGLIGKGLGISEDTVKTHIRKMFRKIRAADRANAVRIGIETGLIVLGDRPPPPDIPTGFPVPTSGLLPATARRPHVVDQHIAACFAAESCPCRTGSTWRWPARTQAVS